MLVNVILMNGDDNNRIIYSKIEKWSDCNSPYDVFKKARKMYGRCTNKLLRGDYTKIEITNSDSNIESGDNRLVTTGWGFEKKEKDPDGDVEYLQRALIEPLKKTVVQEEFHYAMNNSVVIITKTKKIF